MQSSLCWFFAATVGCALLDITAACAATPATARLHPQFLTLRGGKTQQKMRLEIRDSSGNLLPTAGASVTWSSDDPAVAQVDQTGTVRGLRLGETFVHASVTRDGQTVNATAAVHAGHLRMEPPYLRLAMNGTITAQLRIDAANPDGTPADLTGKPIVYQVNIPNGNTDAAVTVDANGKVKAVKPGLSIVTVMAGTMTVHNAVNIRVMPYQDSVEYTRYQEEKIAFVVPKRIRDVNYEQMFQDYQVPKVANAAHGILEEMSGIFPSWGDLHMVGHDVGGDITRAGYSPLLPDPTIPCGGSGNPTQLGTDIGMATMRTCALWYTADSPATPWWQIIFHEWGHDFTLAGSRNYDLFAQTDSPWLQGVYGESLATSASLFTGRMLLTRNDRYKFDPEIIRDIVARSSSSYGNVPYLDDYLAGGANYSQVQPDAVTEMLIHILEEYGYGVWYRFSSIYAPAPVDFHFSFQVNTSRKQATLIVASMSAAAGHDLRPRYRAWGFPIDDAFYNQIYPEVERLAATRDPSAYAGADRTAQLNRAVALNDSETFDPEDSPLRLEWRVLSQPAGSTATLSDPAALHPSFTADRAGEYLLSLTAADDLVTGKPSFVRVRITGATPCAPASVPAGFDPDGGTSRIKAAAGCATEAAGTADWITLTPASDGADVKVAPNPSAKAREAAITFSGQTVAIRQAGARCTFTFDTREVVVPRDGGEGSVGFTASAQDCEAAPYSYDAWLTATVEGSSIRYKAAPTLRAAVHDSFIRLPGAMLKVRHTGVLPCARSLGAWAKTYPLTGASDLIALGRSIPGCVPVMQTDQSWLTVWVEDGGLRVVVDPNPTPNLRMATATLDFQQKITVFQAGTQAAAPVFTLDRNTVAMEIGGGEASVNVTSIPAATPWTAVSHNEWINISAGATGTGAGTVTFTVWANSNGPRTGTITVGTETVTVSQAGYPVPVLAERAAVNAGDYSERYAPGMIVSLFGAGMSADGPAAASTLPLPTLLSGVQVQVLDGMGSRNAPLYYVSPGQINAQLPFGLGPQASISVTTVNGASAPVTILVTPYAPSVFTKTQDGKGEALVIRNADGTLVSADKPLRPGEWVFLYANGLGAVAPPLEAGTPGGDGAARGPLNRTTAPVTVSLGGKTVTADFAGAAPGLTGIYQVNFQIPEGIGTGNLDLVISIGGASSQAGVSVPCSAN